MKYGNYERMSSKLKIKTKLSLDSNAGTMNSIRHDKQELKRGEGNILGGVIGGNRCADC